MQNSFHREILQIALPAILSNITVPLLGLIDLTIVGHLGDTIYIGAIAIGSMLFNMLYWALGFLRMGTSGLTAQAYGAEAYGETTRILYRSLTISSLMAILLIILQYPILQLAFEWIDTSTVIRHEATTYFYICIWGAPAALGLYSWTGWFIGMQNARYPMWIAIIQNITNILASLTLVYGFQLKVEGIAWGTVIAQYVGFAAACYGGKKLLATRLPHLGDTLRDKAALIRFFKVNRDIFLRTLCLIAVTAFFTAAGASFGDTILAANALLLQFFTLYSYFMDGFAYAGEALTGKYWGAQRGDAFRQTLRALVYWGIGVSLTVTLCYAGGGKLFLSLLTNQTTVVVEATHYLGWVITIPIISTAAFILDGLCIGTTATDKMLQSMFVAACIFFAVYYLLVSSWGNHGLWMAFLAYLAFRGLMQAYLMRSIIRQKK